MHLRDFVQAVRADLHPHTVRGMLVRSAGFSATIKIFGVLIAFLASLLYARALGPHDYGLYAYVIAWTTLLAIPSGLGLPQYLVREGAKLPECLSALREWADRRVLFSGIVAGLVLACFALIPQAADARVLFLIAAPLPLLSNLSVIRQALLQAHGWVARSQWPQQLLAPAATLAIVAGLWWTRGSLHTTEVMLATVACAWLAFVCNALQLRPVASKTLNRPPSGVLAIRRALPFVWLGAVYLLLSRTDLIMLGSLRGARDTGIYVVAARAAEHQSIMMGAANTALAPKIARLHKANDDAALQRLLTAASRRVMLVTLPLAAVLILAAHPLLSRLYGSEYAEGASAMRILAFAQLVIVAGGPLGTVLDMSGFERINLLSMAAAVAVNVVLNLTLIPHYGITGAAAATLISVVFARCMLWYQVRIRLGLNAGILRF
jgi:O-antigen/teichoic acid export membrane protein